MLLELRRHIVGQADARVVHGAQQAFDLQLGVQDFGDALNTVDQVA